MERGNKEYFTLDLGVLNSDISTEEFPRDNSTHSFEEERKILNKNLNLDSRTDSVCFTLL